MAEPNIPDIQPNINISRKQVANLLLTSIGLEELSLAHIMNAEGEKLQKMICKANSLDDLFDVNDSIDRTLRTIVKKEILLQFKFENTLELIRKEYRHHCGH